MSGPQPLNPASGNAGIDDPGAVRLDLKGLNCPLPVLKTRRALARMAPGARLLVEATDPMAAIDMPHFCTEAGHRLVGRATDGPVLRFLIERA